MTTPPRTSTSRHHWAYRMGRPRKLCEACLSGARQYKKLRFPRGPFHKPLAAQILERFCSLSVFVRILWDENCNVMLRFLVFFFCHCIASQKKIEKCNWMDGHYQTVRSFCKKHRKFKEITFSQTKPCLTKETVFK